MEEEEYWGVGVLGKSGFIPNNNFSSFLPLTATGLEKVKRSPSLCQLILKS